MNLLALWPWLCYGWLIGEAALALFMRTWKSGGRIRDRGSLLLVWIAITASFMGSDWVQQLVPARIFGGADWLRPLSFGLLVTGLTIRAVAVITLGRAFSVNVAIRKSQTVKRNGLYRYVRHPAYLGMELALLAVGLHSRNWAVLLWMVTPPTLALIYRIHVEEALLHEAFGEEYAAYSRVTRRMIPGVF
jgi:protein-S-isoprenylcysteine O-methyltransferase Ste14